MPMVDDPQQVEQDEFERLPSQPTAHVDSVVAAEIERLLAQAEHTIALIDPLRGGVHPDVRPFELAEFICDTPNTEGGTLESRCDAELDLAIEFGRARIDLQDVLRLRKGSVVPLDKPATDLVDIIVNGRLIARGEVLVLNDNFCVRVAELIAGNKQINCYTSRGGE